MGAGVQGVLRLPASSMSVPIRQDCFLDSLVILPKTGAMQTALYNNSLACKEATE